MSNSTEGQRDITGEVGTAAIAYLDANATLQHAEEQQRNGKVGPGAVKEADRTRFAALEALHALYHQVLEQRREAEEAAAVKAETESEGREDDPDDPGAGDPG